MLCRYPQSTLQDVYKNCFQDYFGPAHIVPSREATRQYIERELAQIHAVDSCYYEPCGWRGQYYRVNLSIVSDGIMSLDDFADAFYRSVPEETPEVTSQWIVEWECIAAMTHVVAEDLVAEQPQLSVLLSQFSGDSTAISSMLAEQKYVLHHSPRYNAAYAPHYRIIRRDIFEREILPLLTEL